MKDMAMEEKKSFGWGIIIMILFSVAKNFGVVIYFGYYKLRKRMRSMFDAEDNQKDSPHTSDGKSETIESINSDEVMEELKK